MPLECIEVAQISKQPIIGTNNLYGSSVERLFVQERFVEQYKNSFNMRGGGGECEAADRQAKKRKSLRTMCSCRATPELPS